MHFVEKKPEEKREILNQKLKSQNNDLRKKKNELIKYTKEQKKI